MSNKQFWDSEELVNTMEVTDKKKFELKLCMLKSKEYVVFSELGMSNEGWKPKKNRVIPKDVFDWGVEALKKY